MSLLQRVVPINNRGFLNNLDPHYVHKLEGLALEAQFDQGQVIFHAGDASAYFYIIESGSVVLEIPGPDGVVEITEAAGRRRAGLVFAFGYVRQALSGPGADPCKGRSF
jgi:cAMP-binding proteins - catabolite gene activator and regulatory subunit of cAMP-dependent protein kinases